MSTLSSLSSILCKENLCFEAIKSYLERDPSSINKVNQVGDSPLMQLLGTKKCSMHILELFLRYGADVNFRNKFGTSVLVTAIKYSSDQAIVRALIEGGANVSHFTEDNVVLEAPLTVLLKSENCSIEDVELFIRHGADVNCRDSSGISPLVTAIKYSRNPAIITALAEGGANVSPLIKGNIVVESPLIELLKSENCSADIVRLFLRYGADILGSERVHWYPLFAAICCSKDVEIIKMLVEDAELFIHHGADVNCRDSSGISPLVTAIKYSRNPAIITALVEGGANVSPLIKGNIVVESPLIELLKSENCSADIVKLFLRYGADVLGSERVHWYSLLAAICCSKNEEIIQMLVEEGAIVSSFTMSNGVIENPLVDLLMRKNCSVNIIKLFLSNHADVNCRNSFGFTPLMTAIRYSKDEAIIRLLVEGGASLTPVMFQNNTLENPLTELLLRKSCSVDIVKFFLLNHADVNCRNIFGFTPLMTAIKCSKDETIIRVLVEGGSSITPFIFQNGTVENPLTELLLRESCSVDIVKFFLLNPADVNCRNSFGFTPLMTAIKCSKDETIIRVLVEGGSSITPFIFQNGTVENPLTELLLRESCSVDIVEFFLLNHADVNCRNSCGFTPLRTAIKYCKNESIIRTLVEGGAHLSINENEDSPLVTLLETETCSIDLVKLFLDYGADVNCRGMYGETPLMTAIKYCKNESIIRTLVEGGAHLTINRNEDSHLITLLESETCSFDLVKLFLDYGADVNHKRMFGKTPLMTAIEHCKNEAIIRTLVEGGAHLTINGNEDSPLITLLKSVTCSIDLVKIFLDYGADVNHEGMFSKTPLMTAIVYCKNEAIIRTLVEGGAHLTINENKDSPLIKLLESWTCSFDLVKLFIDYGADVNHGERYGITPLMTAIKHCKNESIIITLVEAGAHVEAKSSLYGPLIKLLKRENCTVNIVEFFLNHGADIYWGSESPLCVALCHNPSEDIVKLLMDGVIMDRGFSPSDCNEHDSVLHCAVANPNSGLKEDVFKFLLETRPEIKNVGPDVESLLCFALQNNAGVRYIEMLLSAGASYLACGKHSSLMLCFTEHFFLKLDVLQLLLNAGASLDVVDDVGSTLLRRALSCKCETGVIEMLLDRTGVDINSDDCLLHLAVKGPNCNPSTVEMMIKRGALVDKVNHLRRTVLQAAVNRYCCSDLDFRDVIKILLLNGCEVNAKDIFGNTFLSLYVEKTVFYDINIIQALLVAGAEIKQYDRDELCVLKSALDQYDEHSKQESHYESQDEQSHSDRTLSCLTMLIKWYFLQNPNFDIQVLIQGHKDCEKFSDFAKRCLFELENMKSENVGLGRTLYQFVSEYSSPRKVPANQQPELKTFNFDHLLRTGIDVKFPIYFGVISAQIDRGVKEAKMLQLPVYTMKYQNQFSGETKVTLKKDCVFKITRLLSDDDLLRCILAFSKIPVDDDEYRKGLSKRESEASHDGSSMFLCKRPRLNLQCDIRK